MSSVKELYEAHADGVHARLLRAGIKGSALDDLLQLVFCIACRRSADIPEDEEHARAWLLVVARKVAANWRRLYRHKYEVNDKNAVSSALAEPEDPEEDFAERDLVRRAFCKLGHDDAELLWRHVVEGVSLSEIGTSLGVAKSTADLRVQKAGERLRAELDVMRDGGPPDVASKLEYFE
jgi:RNA polymerase sigma factor (sigma-70 family)